VVEGRSFQRSATSLALSAPWSNTGGPTLIRRVTFDLPAALWIQEEKNIHVKLAVPARRRPRSAWRSQHRCRRIWVGGVMAAILLSSFAGSFYALGLHTRPGWTASAQLYTTSHGRWRPSTSVHSLEELKGVLTVHRQGITGSGITATMALMHLSWQGFRKVIMPPTVIVAMRRISASKRTATFAADVRIPTTLPVYWTVVQFVATDGHSRLQVRSGVMIGVPAERTASNTLTVAQAHVFCFARPRLSYLRYAVYLHGYFIGLFSAGDGPGAGIVLDRPRHLTSAVLHTGDDPHGILMGGVNMPKHGWSTTPGFLECTNGKPTGFSAND